MTIGKLERVELREVWKHEALDFTKWLQENLDVLNEVLDLSLSSAEREQSAGSFNVDLVAEDETGNAVVIENQLEKSNHDHLGKIITYVAAIDAKAAVWIVKDPRPEHVGAVSWLNQSSPVGFYLLKVEAVKIGDSLAAPLLTLIVGPSEESREAGETKMELAERYTIRRRFWTELLDRAKQKTKLHSAISPTQDNWVGTTAGERGLVLNYVIRKHEVNVELYIDRGKDADDENETIFDTLAASKAAIEDAFGAPLEWQRLEGKRACRIKKEIGLGGYRDEAKWPAIQDAMIDAMVRLDRALRPYIRKLQA
jgi:hypothetical protein